MLEPASAKATVAELVNDAMPIGPVIVGSPAVTATFEVAVGTPRLQSAAVVQFAAPA